MYVGSTWVCIEFEHEENAQGKPVLIIEKIQDLGVTSRGDHKIKVIEDKSIFTRKLSINIVEMV